MNTDISHENELLISRIMNESEEYKRYHQADMVVKDLIYGLNLPEEKESEIINAYFNAKWFHLAYVTRYNELSNKTANLSLVEKENYVEK